MHNVQILLLYRDSGKSNAVRDFLTSKGYVAVIARSIDEAKEIVRKNSVELLLTDSNFAVNTNNSHYQEFKLINPMLLIIKLNVETEANSFSGEGNSYDFEYCQKMLNTLDVLENSRSLCYFRIN